MSSLAPFVLVGLALPLAACGGSDTGAEPAAATADSVAEAVENTLAAGTAKFTLTLEHTRDERTFGVEAGERESTDGEVDFEQRRTVLGASGGFGDEVLVDATDLYFRAAAEGDREWQKYDLSPEPGDAFAPDISYGRFDVVRQLEYAASLSSSLRPAGEESVHGAPTTRYTGNGDAESLMRALVSDVLYPRLPWSTHSSTVEPSDFVPFDVWVGEDGRVHRLEYDFPRFDSLVGELTTIELRDFGADVVVMLPDAEEQKE